jgi:hydrogenase maturation protease
MMEHRGLILAAGNPARQDDGLGPAAAAALEDLHGVIVDCGYQFNVEDAGAVATSSWVVFIDAFVGDGDDPWRLKPVTAAASAGYTSHSVDPAQVVALADEIYGADVPAYTLGIRGYSFEMFEEGLTARAQENLDAAVASLREWASSRESDQNS